jgi:hypothetical protein
VGNRYRVWIVRYQGRPPENWRKIPANSTAIEPAERGAMTAKNARRYIEAFNRAAQMGPKKIWAVALPVRICYVGEPQPGEVLTPS